MKINVKRHAVVQPQDQSIRLIALTQGQNAIVDASDYDWLNQWNWQAQWDPKVNSFYAVRSHGVRKMHRQIVQCQSGVDHRNHDTLDNRRSNLRPATNSQNGANRKMPSNNTSGYKGVDWIAAAERWQARAQVDGIRVCIGYYTTSAEAAVAYRAFVHKKCGEFAHD